MRKHALVLLLLAVLTSLVAWWPQADDAVLAVEHKQIAAGVSAADIMRIRISKWNAREMANQSLEIQLEGDQWVLPQHYNYPADASDRIGELAGTLLGLRLGVPMSSQAGLYEECHLYDPTDSKTIGDRQHGFGTRVQMWTGDDHLILDIIIGSALNEDPSKHYLRMHDGQSIFRIPWSLDLPLHFVDWVDRSVTQIDAADIKSITLDQYRIIVQEGKLKKEKGLRVNFKRGNVEGLWRSANADPGKKTNDAAVHGLMKSLIKGTFQGVRPFSSDSKDLARYGFYISPRGLLGDKGVLSLASRDGVTYNIFMGKELKPNEKRELQDNVDYHYIMLVCSYDFEADYVRSNDVIDTKMKAGRTAAAALNKRFAQYIYIVDDRTYRDLHPRIRTLFMDEATE